MRRRAISYACLLLALIAAAAAWGPGTPVASAAPPLGALAGAGERPGATRLSFTAGDSVQAQIDVGSGNLLVTVRGLTLPGVNQPVQLGAFYNSAASGATTVPRLGRGWGLDYTPDVHVVQNADSSVTYYGPGGVVGGFDLASGSTTAYTAPAGFKDDLVKSAYGWTLTDHTSQEKLTFNTAGALTSRADRNGNVTTIAQSGSGAFPNLTITAPAGGTDPRTAHVGTNAAGTTTLSQGVSNPLRSATFTRPSDVATSFVDARGRTTTFSYVGTGLLSQITAPGSVVTKFGYDSARRVTSITQTDGTTGGTGDSVTRLAYPSATQTLLADPDTDQSATVASVPHTTYTLDSTQRVTQAVDAAGRTRAQTFTANFDTASSTSGTGAAASTTTNTWGANNGESLTKTQSATGSSHSLSYPSASRPSQYLPTGSTDDAGNSQGYTYNGTGNQLTSAQSTTTPATLTYNTDGTVATSTSPGNGTNSSGYSYTSKQLTGTTPPTGTSLGSRAYTYDSMGRLKTSTDGRGITTTYTYNDDDQVTQQSFSDGSAVSYGYDAAGRNNSRIDASGTTTYGYDDLGRLTSRQNTAGGGQITYTYDKASRLTSTTSPGGGTETYLYDAAGVPTEMDYPNPSGAVAKMKFTTDDQGRRTGTYLQSNDALTVWAARNLLSYDASGRVTHVTADEGPGNSSYTRVVDLSYCYTAGTTPAGGCTTSASSDRDKLVWKKDNLTGQSTTYAYDTAGRLTTAAVSGGNTYDYTYTANSNRNTADAQTLTFNAGNQITTTGYSYDGAGNQTADPSSGATGIGYTGADQLKQVTKSGTTYSYVHAGSGNQELVSQTTPDGNLAYTYGRTDQQGLPIVENLTRSGGNNPGTAAVYSDPVTGEPLMLRSSSGQPTLYVHDGTTGAPIALLTSYNTQAFGYDYDPFGAPVVTQTNNGNGIPQNPYLFATGGVQDRTTGWIQFGARYYNPKTGTFTQQDEADAPLDPANANRYAYAGNDPINNTDPTGECSALKIGLGLFETLSGVSNVGLGGAVFIGTGFTGLGGLLGTVIALGGATEVVIGAHTLKEAC